MATSVRELLVTFGVKVDAGALKKLEAGISGIATAAKVTAGVVAGAAGALFGLAESARRTIDDLDETAQSVGLNTQFFTEFTAAAALGGATMEDTAAAAGVLSRKIVEAREGSKEAQQAFKELGISQKELNSLPTEAIIAKLADGMRDIEDPAKRVALAQELLGRGGKRLIPTLIGGAEAMAKLGDEAREFGLVPGPEAIEAANEMEHSMARARGIVAGMALTVGTKLMPVVRDIADRFTVWVKANKGLIESKADEWIGKLKDVVQLAWDVTVGVAEAMEDFGTGIQNVVDKTTAFVAAVKQDEKAVSLLRDAVVALGAAAVASGLLAVGSAIGTMFAGAGIATFTDALAWIALTFGTAIPAAIGAAATAIGAFLLSAGFLFVAVAVALALFVAHWDEIKSGLLNLWKFIALGADTMVQSIKNIWSGLAEWFRANVIDRILKMWRMVPGVGIALDALGVGGGQSPGRPGSPESALPASASAFGGGRGAGSRSVNIEAPITIHAAPGMSTTEKDDLESRVRRAARQVFEQSARETLAEMG